MLPALKSLWSRLMLRRVQYRAAYGRLRALYSVEDPWNLSSSKEVSRFEAINAIIADHLKMGGDSRVLELGCGEGHHSAYLKQICGTLYGLDVSDLAVRRARLRNPECVFAAGLAEDAASVFPGVRFDLIVASETLYYLKDLDIALAKLKAIAPRLLVTNLMERHQKIAHHLKGPGWTDLAPIHAEGVDWSCCVWQSDGVSR
jgi:SAM-dependent methyltransferase